DVSTLVITSPTYMRLPLPRPLLPLFPYTTLFRSVPVLKLDADPERLQALGLDRRSLAEQIQLQLDGATIAEYREDVRNVLVVARSEEHTSELQSRENLVCRLLLEKKKNKNKN